MFRLVLIVSTVIQSVAAADNQLTPIAATRYDHGLAAKSDGADSAITAREMLLDVTYTDGRPRKGAMVVFFDSSTGRYLWEFGLVPATTQSSTMTSGYGKIGSVYIANDRLILFSWYLTSLVVHESLTRASGIDDAEARALSEATARLPAKLVRATDDRVVIDTGKLLPHEFTVACSTCSHHAPMRVLDVVHKGATWGITLQGQWKEKVTLDNKYQVTATARVN